MPHTPTKPFEYSAGSRKATIAIVGEAFGESEAYFSHPFVGHSGRLLGEILQAAGLVDPYPRPWMDELTMISWWGGQNVFLTNVFPFRPSGFSNDITHLCGTRGEVGLAYSRQPLGKGGYIRPEYLPELDRLKLELQEVNPTIVIAMGAVATWALLDAPYITAIRGAVADCKLIPGLKVLPTFHPAYVLRAYNEKVIVILDVLKAKAESQFREIKRLRRRILVNPNLPEIRAWLSQPANLLSVDVETARKMITHVGFANSPTEALVIPFVGPHRGSYWRSHYEELQAWIMIRDALEGPVPKLFQNGLYDLGYFLSGGIKPRNCIEDTMILAHSQYTEMKKGLGFLGSLFTSEPAWKLMRRKREKIDEKAEKRDD